MDFPVSPDNPDMDFQLDFDSYIKTLTKLKEEYTQLSSIDISFTV